MPIKIYDTLEAAPEALRASAIPTKDDKFAVLEEDPALGEAGKRALEAERTRAATAEAARKEAEKELATLRRTAEAKEKGITEEELQKIRDAEAAARKPIEEERDRLAAENRRLKHTDRVQALALHHGVMTDRIEDAMLTLAQRTDLTSDGTGIVVKGKDGSVTTETIEDFLSKTFKAEKPWLYSGTGSNGGGSSGSDGVVGNDTTGAAEARAAGKAAADQQKKTAKEGDLAFR